MRASVLYFLRLHCNFLYSLPNHRKVARRFHHWADHYLTTTVQLPCEMSEKPVVTTNNGLFVGLGAPVQNQQNSRFNVGLYRPVVVLRPLRHGHIQRILDPSAVNRDHSPIPEQQLHAAGVHVELAGSFIVLHVCVLSALRHLYSCDLCDTVFFLIRFWTHSRREGAFILFSEENKKSEPFSYREKVRIFIVWCE